MTALPSAREYVQLERAMQQAESVWRHEAGGPERAADMRRCFQKLWDLAYPPAELADGQDDEPGVCITCDGVGGLPDAPCEECAGLGTS